MSSWHLRCTKDNNQKLVKTNDHIFEVVGDSALGKAFENAEPGSFILHENLAYTGTDGPFCKVLDQSDHAKPLLNGGKEYILRKLTSMGCEVIGPETVVTHQAFPTRFYKDKDNIIRIFVHFSFCCRGQCYSFDAVHHTAFFPSTFAVPKGVKNFEEVHNDFIEDTKHVFAAITNSNSETLKSIRTPVIVMEDLYEKERLEKNNIHLGTDTKKPIQQALKKERISETITSNIGEHVLEKKFFF